MAAANAVASVLGDIKKIAVQDLEAVKYSSVVLTNISEYIRASNRELKTQTRLLESINSSLKGGMNINKKDVKTVAMFFGPMMDSMTALMTAASAINAKSGMHVKALLVGIAEGFAELKKDIDKDDADRYAHLISVVARSILLIGLQLAAYATMGALIFVGAVMFAITLRMVGRAIMSFGIKMVMFATIIPVGIVGVLLFAMTIKILRGTKKWMDEFAEDDWKTLRVMGSGILMFGIGLAAYAIVGIAALGGAILFSMTIGILSGALTILNNTVKKKSGKALQAMSIGIFMFGLALSVYLVVGIPAILGALLFALTVRILKSSMEMLTGPKILLGMASLALLGIALVGFALAIHLFDKYATSDGMVKVLLALPLILITGLVFGILGKFWSHIALGALVVTLMSISLVVLGYGLKEFKKSDFNMEDLGMLAAVIGTIAVEFALIGIPVVAGLIALGSLSLILAGTAIIVLSKGLQAFKRIDFDETDSKNLHYALSAIRSAFTGGNEGGILSKLGGAFSGAIDGVAMGVAATGYALAGIALESLAAGLTAFKYVQFTEEDSTELQLMLESITGAFAIAGGAGSGQGLLGFVGISPNATEKGIKSLMDAGDALDSIVDGLKAFKSLDSLGLGSDAFDPNVEGSVLWNIKAVVGVLHEVFAAIGAGNGEDDRSIFGSLFRAKRTDTEKGIRAVMDVGQVLADIAESLKVWNDLDKMGINIDTIGKNIGLVVTVIGNAFASIGGQETEDSALWGLVSWDENTVQKGIDAVRGVGSELKDIADGLKIFAEVDKNYDIVTVGKNISSILRVVGNAFAAIGGQETEDSALWGLIKWDESAVQKGLDAVDGIGEEFKNIAEGAKHFADLKNPSKIGDNIASILGSVLDVFSFTNRPLIEKESELFSKFVDSFVDMANSESDIAKIAKHFDKIQKSMGSFKTNVNNIDADKLALLDSTFASVAAMAAADKIGKLSENIEESIENGMQAMATIFADAVGEMNVSTSVSSQRMVAATTQQANQPINIKTAAIPPAVLHLFEDINGNMAAINRVLHGELDVNVMNKNEIG